MENEKQSWFSGPYPWLVSTIAFLLPSINYFAKDDITGGAIFFVLAVMFFVNFLSRIKQNKR